jgi:TonB family protein
LLHAQPVVKIPAVGYTKEARIAELEGAVLLEATIGVDGNARDLAVHRPLGLGLDEQAIDAVRSWSFVPAETDVEAGPPVRRIIRVDFQIASKSSRWHLIGVTFDTPEGSARPEFSRTVYPPGAGIVRRPDIVERAQILGGIGRPATATLSFVVNEQGRPIEIRVESDSDPMWGSQAEALVNDWRFKPGMKDGKPIAVACSVDLLWGPRSLSADVADRFSSVSRARR